MSHTSPRRLFSQQHVVFFAAAQVIVALFCTLTVDAEMDVPSSTGQAIRQTSALPSQVANRRNTLDDARGVPGINIDSVVPVLLTSWASRDVQVGMTLLRSAEENRQHLKAVRT